MALNDDPKQMGCTAPLAPPPGPRQDGVSESGRGMQHQDAASAHEREPRDPLPLGLPAHLLLPGGERAFVTLRNLSVHGAQAQRPGKMRLDPSGLRVQLEVIDYDHGCMRQCRAHVRWIKASDYITTLGLEFDQPDPPFLTFVQAMADWITPSSSGLGANRS